MPDKPIKPPNKDVEEQITKMTIEMWDSFKLTEKKEKRDEKIVSFLIKKLAEVMVQNRKLEQQINEILNR